MSRTSIDHTGYSAEGVVIGAGVARRVVVLTEDEFRQLTEEAAYCPKCDDE